MEFRIVDNATGEEPDLERIALEEEWAKGLIYCDMEGFALSQEGNLILLDECGSYRHCPLGRFGIAGGIDYPEKVSLRSHQPK